MSVLAVVGGVVEDFVASAALVDPCSLVETPIYYIRLWSSWWRCGSHCCFRSACQAPVVGRAVEDTVVFTALVGPSPLENLFLPLSSKFCGKYTSRDSRWKKYSDPPVTDPHPPFPPAAKLTPAHHPGRGAEGLNTFVHSRTLSKSSHNIA